MKSGIQEYKVCSQSHYDKIDNFCEKCCKFICEECSEYHLDHIEHIVDWKSMTRDYLNTCINHNKRAHILLKTTSSLDQLRAEVFAKIDATFDIFITRMQHYRQQYKTEVWAAITSLGGLEKTENKEKLSGLVDEVNRIIAEITEVDQKKDKEKVIKAMQMNVLSSIQGEIAMYKEKKTKGIQTIHTIRELKIDTNFSYAHLKDLLIVQPTHLHTLGIGGIIGGDNGSGVVGGPGGIGNGVNIPVMGLQFEGADNSKQYGFLYQNSNNGKSTTKIKKDEYITSVSSQPRIVNKGKYEVQIEIDHYNSDDIQIGIGPPSEWVGWMISDNGIVLTNKGLNVRNAIIKKNSLQEGDIVKMEADVTGIDATIQFYKNSVKEGPLIKFDPARKYSFGVAMRKCSTKVSIISAKFGAYE